MFAPGIGVFTEFTQPKEKMFFVVCRWGGGGGGALIGNTEIEGN